MDTQTPRTDSTSAVLERVPQARHQRDPRRFAEKLLDLTTGQSAPAVNRLGWIVFLVFAAAAVGQVFAGVDQQDEGELLTYPWLIAHGAVPYRDIWMMYPPGVFMTLAGLVKMGISAIFAERGLSVVARLGYVLLVNRALTGRWSRFSWLGVPLAFSLVFLSSEIRASPYVIAGPLFLVGLLSLRRGVVLPAVCFVLAGVTRFEMGVAGVVALSTLAVLPWSPAAWRWRYLLGAAATLVTLVAVYGVLNYLTGGQAIQQIFVDPILKVNPGRRLPLFPPYFGPIGVPVELALLLSPPVLILVGLKRRQPYLVATNLGVLILLSQFFQRADWEHLFTTAAIVLPWALISLVGLADTGPGRVGGQEKPIPRPVLRALAWAALPVTAWAQLLMVAWAIYFSSLSPLASFHGWSFAVTFEGRTIVTHNAPEARDDMQVARYLASHRRAGDTVFIAPARLRYAKYNTPVLYYLIGMRPASKYLEMNPGEETTASVQQTIIRELRGCPWVVLWRIQVDYEPNASHIPGSDLLNRYVHTHYTPVLQDTYYQVLRARQRVATAATASLLSAATHVNA